MHIDTRNALDGKTSMKNYKWTKIKSNKEVETGSKWKLPEFWRR